VRADEGFSLAEMLVALLLTLVVVGAMSALVDRAVASSQAQPEALDMQQRARVGADVLLHDLLAAGAGVAVGEPSGPLGDFLPPIIPRRLGLLNADGPTIARPDAVTIVGTLGTSSQTRTAAPFVSAVADVVVENELPCPTGRPVCGLATGMHVLVFDRLGHFDMFGVTQVAADSARLQLHARTQSGEYQAGAFLAEAETHTYYFDAANSQLRHYDGNQTDVPVVDHVSGLSIEYFGVPSPPLAPKPPAGTENCVYTTTGEPRGLVTLAAVGGALAPLPLSMLADGPWCGGGSNQFDVDLLRIRKMRVTLRVEATPDAFRAHGLAFARPGTSRSSNRYLPDEVLTFDVAPRNLGAGWRQP
jgi:hypothetical protein